MPNPFLWPKQKAAGWIVGQKGQDITQGFQIVGFDAVLFERSRFSGDLMGIHARGRMVWARAGGKKMSVDYKMVSEMGRVGGYQR